MDDRRGNVEACAFGLGDEAFSDVVGTLECGDVITLFSDSSDMCCESSFYPFY